jgi:hypothetical protein
MTGVLEEPNRILRNLVLTVHSVVSVKVTHDAPNAGYELRRTAPSARWPCSAAPLSASRIDCANNFDPGRSGWGSPKGLKPARS